MGNPPISPIKNLLLSLIEPDREKVKESKKNNVKFFMVVRGYSFLKKEVSNGINKSPTLLPVPLTRIN
jgi:hypothetical protein